MLENINQEQFDYLINILIQYKILNKKKDVYLNEKSVKEAIHYFNNIKSEIFNKTE